MTRSLLENLSAKRFCSVKRLCTGSRRYCLAKLRPEGRPRTSGPKASAGHQPICLQPEDGTIGLLPDDIPDQGVSVEVTLSGDTSSAILAEQVKNLDWVAREASLKARVSPDELLG